MTMSAAGSEDSAGERAWRGIAQGAWMLIPVLSMSFVSFIPAAQVYWKARTKGWLLTTILIALGSAAVLTGLALDADGAGFGGVIIVTAASGVAAAAAGRNIMFNREKPKVDPAVQRVLNDRERRDQAREIAEEDPEMALELGIGRPDLPRAYADGGLVDLNNVSADGIIRTLGWNRDTSEAFVAERDARHGYTSVTEIGALSSLPPVLLENFADRIVVLPYRHRHLDSGPDA